MKLIDADKFKQDLLDKSFYPAIVAAAIKRAPTVNPYEWISVEEKLPESEKVLVRHDGHIGLRSIRVLCACRQKSGKIFVKEGYYEKWDFSTEPHWRIPGSIDSVTHWMLLPVPPTEKEN